MTILLAALLAGAAVHVMSGPPISVRLRRDRPRSHRVWRVAGRRGAEADRRAAVVDLCAALAAELRAGRQPDEALAHAARYISPVAPRAVAAAATGFDAVGGLIEDAALPGADGLRGVAACLEVAAGAGAGLADAIERVHAAIRAEQEQRDRIAAELAGPRATARLLAGLPVVGLAIGHAIGADPVGVLLGTTWGLAVLAAGLALNGLGLWWVSALAARAQEPRTASGVGWSATKGAQWPRGSLCRWPAWRWLLLWRCLVGPAPAAGCGHVSALAQPRSAGSRHMSDGWPAGRGTPQPWLACAWVAVSAGAAASSPGSGCSLSLAGGCTGRLRTCSARHTGGLRLTCRWLPICWLRA